MSLSSKQWLLDMESGDPTRIALHTDPLQKRMTGTTVHGNLYFDAPFVSLVEDNRADHHALYQGGCEDGLVLPEDIDFVISLYPWEQYTINHDAERIEIKMYDSTDQTFEQVNEVAELVNEKRKEGTVLVHCQAGLNRSGLVAARSLMLLGMTADEAITRLRETRSQAVLCNPSFEKWLRSL